MIEAKPITNEQLRIVHEFLVEAADTETGKKPNKKDLEKLINDHNMESILRVFSDNIITAIISSIIITPFNPMTKIQIIHKILGIMCDAETIYKFTLQKSYTLMDCHINHKPILLSDGICENCSDYSLCWKGQLDEKEN